MPGRLHHSLHGWVPQAGRKHLQGSGDGWWQRLEGFKDILLYLKGVIKWFDYSDYHGWSYWCQLNCFSREKGFMATPKKTQNINQAGSWETKLASREAEGRNTICGQQEGLWAEDGIYHIIWSLSLGKEQLHRQTPGCLHQLEACKCSGNHHNPGTETGQECQCSCWEALLLLETRQLRPCLAISEPLTPCPGKPHNKGHLPGYLAGTVLKAGGLCAQELAFFISLYGCSSNQTGYLSKVFTPDSLYLKWASQFPCLLPGC